MEELSRVNILEKIKEEINKQDFGKYSKMVDLLIEEVSPPSILQLSYLSFI